MRALASQSGRAPGVYPSHRLYLLTGLLTRLIGTEKTERDAEDGHRAIPQVKVAGLDRATGAGSENQDWTRSSGCNRSAQCARWRRGRQRQPFCTVIVQSHGELT